MLVSYAAVGVYLHISFPEHSIFKNKNATFFPQLPFFPIPLASRSPFLTTRNPFGPTLGVFFFSPKSKLNSKFFSETSREKTPSFPGILLDFSMGRTGLFDLEKHFAFYGAYHSNPINIAIHMLFVWPIFFTALLILYFTPSLFNLPHIEFSLLGIHIILLLNIGFLLALIYSVFYVCLDVKAGSLAALLCVISWVTSSFIASRLGFSLAWKVVLVAQLLCWTGQFIGHGIFEKRAPALLDNLVQAFIMAPFFVLLEALQNFFGYEPYPGFQAIVHAKIEAKIDEWKDKKEKLIP